MNILQLISIVISLVVGVSYIGKYNMEIDTYIFFGVTFILLVNMFIMSFHLKDRSDKTKDD